MSRPIKSSGKKFSVHFTENAWRGSKRGICGHYTREKNEYCTNFPKDLGLSPSGYKLHVLLEKVGHGST